jgi:hypothetical protein
MKVYQIFASLIDVFLDDGWLNWSRWRLIKGHWVQVGGPTIKHPALIIKQLTEVCNGSKA